MIINKTYFKTYFFGVFMKKIVFFILAISVFASLNTKAQSWQTVGSALFSAGRADYTSIETNVNENPGNYFEM